MCPFVRRKVKTENPLTHGVRLRDIEIYVPRRKMLRGDQIVEPTEKQLAELAEQYPEEFGEMAKARGIDLETEAEPEVERFASATADDAIKIVEETNDVELLAAFIEVEEERAKPRVSVLRAIEQKIEEVSI